MWLSISIGGSLHWLSRLCLGRSLRVERPFLSEWINTVPGDGRQPEASGYAGFLKVPTTVDRRLSKFDQFFVGLPTIPRVDKHLPQIVSSHNGGDEPLLKGDEAMPLNEIPRHLNAETRGLIEAALEDAWQELRKDGNVEAKLARSTLRTTMVALASVGETDHGKLKSFAIHAWRGRCKPDEQISAHRDAPHHASGG